MSLSKKAISVIIPVYNTEKYLSQCLESVLKQSFADFEVICVNDCSSDHSLDILKSYAAKDQRITVIDLPARSGVAAARNAALKVAEGKYIYFVDSDDAITQNLLGDCFQLAEKENFDQIIFEADVINELETPAFFEYHFSEEFGNKIFKGYELLSAMGAKHSLVMVPCLRFTRKKLLTENRISFPEGFIHEDNYFTIRCLLDAERVYVLKKSYYLRRLRANSIMTDRSDEADYQHVKNYFGICLKLISDVPGALSGEAKKRAFADGLGQVIYCFERDLEKLSPSAVHRLLSELSQNINLEELYTVLNFFQQKSETGKFISIVKHLVSQAGSQGVQITVILPTYNRREFLPSAIKCIVDQSFKAWRLLVLNDGGEDVGDIVAQFNDPRIEYIDLPHQGKPGTVNHALSLVKSKYIAYMDDDDEVFPEHLEMLFEAAEINNSAFVYSDTYLTILDENGNVVSKTIENDTDVTYEDIRFYNRINHKQILHTKELADKVGLYDDRMSILIDYDYIKRLAKLETPYHVHEITGNHYLRGSYQNQISGLWAKSPSKAGKSLLALFEKDPESLSKMYSEYEQISKLADLQAAFYDASNELNAIKSSLAFKVGTLLAAPWRIVKKLFNSFLIKKCKRVIDLCKKTVNSLRTYGIRWTLYKIYKFILNKFILNNNISEQNKLKCQTIEFFHKSSAESNPNLDVTVVVPVYNGLNHLERLIPSLLKNTHPDVEIFFIDDCSPDKEIYPYLLSWAEKNPQIKVFRNEKNLGFVKTVNWAFQNTKNHVILLNSDTEVPPQWVERMMGELSKDVASVTPFSNAATIFSFPFTDSLNRNLLEYFSVDEISEIFSEFQIPEAYNSVPTGVGFCMLLNRAALNVCGNFDAERFGIGYGEETDWCLRALYAGFRNVICADLFVAHYDGGSFSQKQKTEAFQRNEIIFSQSHPKYKRMLLEHNNRTESCWKELKQLACIRLFSVKRLKPILVLSHPFIGGSIDFLINLKKQNEERSVFILKPDYDGIMLDISYKEYNFSLKLENLDVLLHPVGGMQFCDDIIVNHLWGWQRLFKSEKFSVDIYKKVLDKVYALKQHFSAEMRFMVHDFWAICPQYTLLNNKDEFCDPDSDVEKCKGCIPALSLNNDIKDLSGIKEWRLLNNQLISECKECRFFSSSSQKIFTKVISAAKDNMTLVPHQPLVHYTPLKDLPVTPVTIAIIGNINLCKGSKFIKLFAEFLRTNAPEVRIVILGAVDHPAYPKNVHCHGPYKREELPELLKHYGVNIGFISSICPETFSYTTQEFISLGLPTVCFNIGAPAERISNWEKGLVIPEITPEKAWETIKKLHSQQYKTK